MLRNAMKPFLLFLVLGMLLNCSTKKSGNNTKNLALLLWLSQSSTNASACTHRGLHSTGLWASPTYAGYYQSPYIGKISESGTTTVCDAGASGNFGLGYATFDYPAAGTYKLVLEFTDDFADKNPVAAVLDLDIEKFTNSTSTTISTVSDDVINQKSSNTVAKAVCRDKGGNRKECSDTAVSSQLRRSVWFDNYSTGITCSGSGCTYSISQKVSITKVN